jgi:alkanesulfonate monooxygenase SsuD/methylene tetrahydromethanopterin reductase-like flavin-dependent oxidoreductase (luciferase family)
MKRPSIQFGIAIDPEAGDIEEPFRRAKVADDNGVELITMMDHPYNTNLFETWTLLTAITARTKQVKVATDVANLPLRLPAMLAKQAATLDVLSGGRVELGLGTGAYWAGIVAMGGPKRSGPEAYQAFDDAMHIIRGYWENAGKSFSYEGQIYGVKGVRPGPKPAHRIPIWTGAAGPKMLNLTGRLADGVWVSTSYVSREKLLENNERIDAGAAEAGRDTAEIRRGYNVMGILDLGRPDTTKTENNPNNIYGPVDHWVEQILELYHDYRQDTINFWPVSGNQFVQIEAFAKEVVPAVREKVSQGKRI